MSLMRNIRHECAASIMGFWSRLTPQLDDLMEYGTDGRALSFHRSVYAYGNKGLTKHGARESCMRT